MSRIIAIANQKGGVGKTTTAINLGACLAVAERRTLVIDMDSQGNATSGIGIERSRIGLSLYEVLVDGAPLASAILERVHFPYLDVAPSSRDLVGAEVELVNRPARELLLRRALEPVRDRYEYILVDCPPSLGLLTLNTLAAADAVMIPIQCEFYALEGLSQLLNTVRLVQRNLNPRLQIDGVLLTMFDQRLNLSRQVAQEAHEYFGNRVYRTAIPRNVRLAEAPSFGKPIVLYDIASAGAQSYLALAQEVMARAGALHAGADGTGPGAAGEVGPDTVEVGDVTERPGTGRSAAAHLPAPVAATLPEVAAPAAVAGPRLDAISDAPSGEERADAPEPSGARGGLAAPRP